MDLHDQGCRSGTLAGHQPAVDLRTIGCLPTVGLYRPKLADSLLRSLVCETDDLSRFPSRDMQQLERPQVSDGADDESLIIARNCCGMRVEEVLAVEILAVPSLPDFSGCDLDIGNDRFEVADTAD